MNTNSQANALPEYDQPPLSVVAYLRAADARPTILTVDRLGRVFPSRNGGTVALQNINLELRHREFVSIIGPSGCGKSTLIRILAGLDESTSGQVLVDGKPVVGPGRDRGMVFQGYTLFPWLTVKQNIMFGLRMRGFSKAEIAERAAEWIELVRLTRYCDSYPGQLSGGMKQRVAIARALANEPRILLMDEPFAALDAQTRTTMQEHLLRIWSRVDITILFITHDLNEAIYLSDRIVVLGAHPGRVLETINVPLERPRTTKQFLDGYFLSTKKRLDELIFQDHDLPEEDLTSAPGALVTSPT